MKKVTALLLTAVLLFITGCGTRVPFKKQEPLENAALVYVYVTPDGEFESDPQYKIRINNKRVDGYVRKDEYMILNLKPSKNLTISATKAQIEERSVKLSVQAGQTYYLKVQGGLGGGDFAFVNAGTSVGSKEITKMGLAGSVAEGDDNSFISELISSSSDKQPSQEVQAPKVIQKTIIQKAASKPDELEKAYNLKQKGIITDAEFNKLKAEILAK